MNRVSIPSQCHTEKGQWAIWRCVRWLLQQLSRCEPNATWAALALCAMLPACPILLVIVGGLFGLQMELLQAEEWTNGIPWAEPKVIVPGQTGGPPSDAMVLFNGKDLSQWEGGPWIVKDGYMEVNGIPYAEGQGISTKQVFGDCQLHIEWATPAVVEGSGQERGNSGIFMMGLYEVQVLDSYDNPTYYDGQAAAIYKEHPPLVNVCRKPGEWQVFDIIFEAPRFDDQGKLRRPAYITILHNGVLVQNHFEIQGTTSCYHAPEYAAHAAKLPIMLQYHLDPVRFRNIWVRELPPADAPPPQKAQ